MYTLKIYTKTAYVVLFLIGSIEKFYSQTDTNTTVDSLPYNKLVENFYNNENDSIKAAPFAYEYLRRAKKSQDTVKIADGYYFLSYISIGDISMSYSDSIIDIIKYHENKFYPAFAYLNKAKIYYNDYNFKDAFANFLKVTEEAEKYNNDYLLYQGKSSIGILKSMIGEHETSLPTLKECFNYYKSNKIDMPLYYLRSILALSDAYNLNKKLDSASIYNKLGVEESIRLKYPSFINYFTLNEGVNQYSKGRYITANDSLQKAIDTLKVRNDDKANLSVAYYYFGRTLSELGYKEASIEAHKMVDEIFQEVIEISPNNRDNYEILIDYYKTNGDKDNQLKYIERLIKVDSTLNSNYRYLIKNIVQNYDTPRLLSEKQNIINSLKIDKRIAKYSIIFLTLATIFSISMFVYNFYKRKIYKRRFEELYEKQLDQAKAVEQSKPLKTDTISLDIPKRITQDVLLKLEDFESKKKFLNRDITTNSLAKDLDTNTKYLSKIINTYKQKSFVSYINDLRITHITKALKQDKILRNYTIKAIARTSGFKSDESFSKAFYKINGIKPSYYVKELDNHDEVENSPKIS